MAVYSIRDLERISSTKAHTIRMWEQRYGLLQPERTDTNIRYYSDDQLKKLLNVCTLLQSGMKISHISKLSKEELAAEISKLLANSLNENSNIEAIINQALIATTTFDSVLFQKTFDDAVRSLGWVKMYERVIYPLLVRTGLLWMKDDMLPSEEHFLSNLIRQKLFAAIDGIPAPAKASQKWLLFLNEAEDHEIGLLFACYVIRQFDQDVIYLGARVPYSDLAKVISASKPTHIYSFFVGSQAEDQAANLLSRLTTDFKEQQILVSGGADWLHDLIAGTSITYVPDIMKLTEIVARHES